MNDTKLHNYILDTNIISELVRYNADFNVLKKLVEHNSDCATTVFTIQEMLYGAERLQDEERKNYILDFIENDVLETYPVMNYDTKAARIHAKILAETRRTGKIVPADDTFIAAIALAEDMTLVTRNTKHFEPISEQFGLKIENWFEG